MKLKNLISGKKSRYQKLNTYSPRCVKQCCTSRCEANPSSRITMSSAVRRGNGKCNQGVQGGGGGRGEIISFHYCIPFENICLFSFLPFLPYFPLSANKKTFLRETFSVTISVSIIFNNLVTINFHS